MGMRSRALLLTVSLGWTLLAAPEWEAKAALIYNLVRFVEWPSDTFAGSTDPIVVGVLGKDPVGMALTMTVHDKRIQGRSVKIRRFDHIDKISGCHVVFIGRSQYGNIDDLTRRLDGAPVLTVGDGESFTAAGGMVGLIREADRTRIQLNLPAANRAGLRISARLSSLAEPSAPSRAQR